MEEKNNGVFVRFTDDVLADIDRLIEQDNIKNRQDFIRDAVVAYLSAYPAMKDAATKTFVNHLSEPIAT